MRKKFKEILVSGISIVGIGNVAKKLCSPREAVDNSEVAKSQEINCVSKIIIADITYFLEYC